ncbi:MAG TPA: hypothetical protein VIX37_07700, partial [Candidatus Sulfotelmatobacter sp.]
CEIIAFCPNSPQECFDLTITAFNLAEEFRVPVMFMMDEVVGHMTEKVVIPPAGQIEITSRRHTCKTIEDYLPYGTNGDGVPEMAHAGEGYKFHVTALTHDERGYPNMTPPVRDKLVRRLQTKISNAADRIALFEEEEPKAPMYWSSPTESLLAWRNVRSRPLANRACVSANCA